MARELEKLSDQELLERSSSSDRLAFQVLVDRYGEKLYNLLQGMVSDWALAEDLLQETLLRVYRRRGAARKIRDFRCFIYAVACNLARDKLRKRRREVLMREPSEIDCVADSSNRPDVQAEKGELRERIDSAIQNLSGKQRDVFLLRDIQGFSYVEIGKILKIRVGTVKSRLNRARLKLQKELSSYLS